MDGELIERHPATSSPRCDEEQATGDRRDHDGPGAEEGTSICFSSTAPTSVAGTSDDEAHEQAATGRVMPDQAYRDLADARQQIITTATIAPSCTATRRRRRRRPGAARAAARPRADARSTTPAGLGTPSTAPRSAAFGHRQLGPPPATTMATRTATTASNADSAAGAGRWLGGRGRRHSVGGLHPGYRPTPAGDATPASRGPPTIMRTPWGAGERAPRRSASGRQEIRGCESCRHGDLVTPCDAEWDQILDRAHCLISSAHADVGWSTWIDSGTRRRRGWSPGTATLVTTVPRPSPRRHAAATGSHPIDAPSGRVRMYAAQKATTALRPEPEASAVTAAMTAPNSRAETSSPGQSSPPRGHPRRSRGRT